MAEVLAVEGLTVRLAAHPNSSSILDDVAFTVAPGEVLGIVGESGSGKSVLALSVMGLLPPALRMQARRIAVLATSLRDNLGKPGARIVDATMAMIFQEPMTSLNPVMRIGTQIGEVLRWRGRYARRRRPQARRWNCWNRWKFRRRAAGLTRSRTNSLAACASA